MATFAVEGSAKLFPPSQMQSLAGASLQILFGRRMHAPAAHLRKSHDESWELKGQSVDPPARGGTVGVFGNMSKIVSRGRRNAFADVLYFLRLAQHF